MTQSQCPPAAPAKEEAPQTTQKPAPAVGHKLGVIGAVEPVYFLPMKTPLSARIDTGAEISSLGVQNLKHFERDSEKWVSFDIVCRKTGETQHFEKRIFRKTSIKRINGDEERTVVQMRVRFGGELMTAQFSLADRSKFEYQALIGRNILNGLAVVDTSLSNTLY
ncbi:MAG: RimK/LysX family protein [Lactobacillales bacterium]|nr:RimK/LysX family protein [Lactobacillales bacterium]